MVLLATSPTNPDGVDIVVAIQEACDLYATTSTPCNLGRVWTLANNINYYYLGTAASLDMVASEISC